jgi:hypothetical protein
MSSLNSLRNLAFEWAKEPYVPRTYDPDVHAHFKRHYALISKSAAKGNKFQYVADFFKYASDLQLVELYKQLQKRRGRTINSTLAANRKSPNSFFTIFDRFILQYLRSLPTGSKATALGSILKEIGEGTNLANRFFKKSLTAMHKKPANISARHMLYVKIMEFEEIEGSYLINVLFNLLPSSFEKGSGNNVSPLKTRKNKSIR